MEARIEADTVEEHWLLACSACIIKYIQDHLPRDDIAHSDQDSPKSTTNQRNASQI